MSRDFVKNDKPVAKTNTKDNFEKKKSEEFFFPPKEGKSQFFAPHPPLVAGNNIAEGGAVIQRKEGPFPQEVQNKMEATFAEDFSTVQVYTNSQQAIELNALAYTQGEEIHFAPGSYSPDTSQGQQLIGHELAHVSQQRSGAVTPTIQTKGFDINDNKVLEQQADAMGKKAAGAAPVSAYQSKALHIRNNLRTIQRAQKGVVQLATVPTNYGEFKDKTFSPVSDYGVEIELEFYPNNKVDATKIGLVQTVKGTLGGTSDPFSPTRVERTTPAGLYIDRIDARNNPIYGGQQLAGGDALSKTNLTGSNYKLGWKYPGNPKSQEAYLYDRPTRPGRGNDSGQMFETTALAIEGTQEGTYYGSVQWGWTVDAAGSYTSHPISIVSMGVPSKSFMDAARKWNNATSLGTVKTTKDPINVYDAAYAVSFTVPKGTEVTVSDGSYTSGNVSYNLITVVSDGRTGKIKTADLKDLGTGDPTADLPIVDTYVVSNPAGATLNDGLPGPWRYFDHLPPNTRLRITDYSHMMGPFQTSSPFDYKVDVEVIDGANIGKSGWLNYSDLQSEP